MPSAHLDRAVLLWLKRVLVVRYRCKSRARERHDAGLGVLKIRCLQRQAFVGYGAPG
jgi:hypothetical protein